tara:strand:+ start:142 stop:324 length:183 start_codon:yes stop_codon:yes gene_type:complete
MKLDKTDLMKLETLLEYNEQFIKKRIREEQSHEESPIVVIDALHELLDTVMDLQRRINDE